MILRCPQGHVYDDFDREHVCPHNRDNTMLMLGGVGALTVICASVVFLVWLVTSR